MGISVITKNYFVSFWDKKNLIFLLKFHISPGFNLLFSGLREILAIK